MSSGVFINALFLHTSIVGETHNDGTTGGEEFFILISSNSNSKKFNWSSVILQSRRDDIIFLNKRWRNATAIVFY